MSKPDSILLYAVLTKNPEQRRAALLLTNPKHHFPSVLCKHDKKKQKKLSWGFFSPFTPWKTLQYTKTLLLDASYVFVQLQFVRHRFPKQQRISSEFHSFKRHVAVSSHKLIQTLGPLHEMARIGPQRLSHTIWAAEALSAGYLLI